MIEPQPLSRLSHRSQAPTSAGDLCEAIDLMEWLFVGSTAPVATRSPVDLMVQPDSPAASSVGEFDLTGAGLGVDLERPNARAAGVAGVTRRIAGNAPLIVSVVLGALITMELARAALTLLGGGESPGHDPTARVRAPTTLRPRSDYVRGIVAAHLFGVVADDPNAQDPAQAPPTTADLSLAGTLATGDPKKGLAIISEGGRATLYTVGDGVADGSLFSVYRDHVLLRRQDHLESLSLPLVLLARSGAEATAATASRTGDSERDNDSPKEGSRSAGDLIRGAAAIGYGGKLRGFRIIPVGDSHPFDAAGLVGGDLVVAINGTSLEDQDRETGQNLFNSLKSSSQATLTIERDGQKRNVTLSAAGLGTAD